MTADSRMHVVYAHPTLCRPKPRDASSPKKQTQGIHKSPKPFFMSRLFPLSVVLKVMVFPKVLPRARQQPYMHKQPFTNSLKKEGLRFRVLYTLKLSHSLILACSALSLVTCIKAPVRHSYAEDDMRVAKGGLTLQQQLPAEVWPVQFDSYSSFGHTLTKVNHKILFETLLNHRGFKCFLLRQ